MLAGAFSCTLSIALCECSRSVLANTTGVVCCKQTSCVHNQKHAQNMQLTEATWKAQAASSATLCPAVYTENPAE